MVINLKGRRRGNRERQKNDLDSGVTAAAALGEVT